MERWQKLPKDDFVDISNDLTLSDLEKLDRAAAKTEKNLEKTKRRGTVLGAAAITSNATTTRSKAAVNSIGAESLSKRDRQIEKRMEVLKKNVEADVVKNFGKNKQGFLSSILGDNIAQNLFSFGKSPGSFLKNSVIGAAGVGFALEISKSVLDTIKNLDSFNKVLIDRVNERVNQLRGKEQTARIAAGLQQEIITTEAGSVDARDAYNTFNEFNTNRAKLEEDFAIRNTTGYDE